MAAWNSAGRNRPDARPHQVVPSGLTATIAPFLSTSARFATVAGRVESRSLSRKTPPAFATSPPSTGQLAISLLASARSGFPPSIAFNPTMSSQEMWLCTTSAPLPVPASFPLTTSPTPQAASRQRKTNRTNGCRLRITISVGAETIASTSTRSRPNRRSTLRGSATEGGSSASLHAASQVETGIQG